MYVCACVCVCVQWSRDLRPRAWHRFKPAQYINRKTAAVTIVGKSRKKTTFSLSIFAKKDGNFKGY